MLLLHRPPCLLRGIELGGIGGGEQVPKLPLQLLHGRVVHMPSPVIQAAMRAVSADGVLCFFVHNVHLPLRSSKEAAGSGILSIWKGAAFITISDAEIALCVMAREPSSMALCQPHHTCLRPTASTTPPSPPHEKMKMVFVQQQSQVVILVPPHSVVLAPLGDVILFSIDNGDFIKTPEDAPANVLCVVSILGAVSLSQFRDEDFRHILVALLKQCSINFHGGLFNQYAYLPLDFVFLQCGGECEFMFCHDTSADMLLTDAEHHLSLICSCFSFPCLILHTGRSVGNSQIGYPPWSATMPAAIASVPAAFFILAPPSPPSDNTSP